MTIIDKETEIMNRVQVEHISLKTKLAICINWGKINAIAPENLSKNLVKPWAQ